VLLLNKNKIYFLNTKSIAGTEDRGGIMRIMDVLQDDNNARLTLTHYAADSLLAPMQCEYLALEGISALMDTLERVRAGLNRRLELEGILLTMFDERTTLARQVAEELRSHFPGKVFQTTIPRNVRLAEAPSYGQPILLYDVRSRGAEAYIRLAKELMARESPKRYIDGISGQTEAFSPEIVP